MKLQALNRRNKASILIAEDESIVRADVEDHLKSFGYRVSASVDTGEEAKRQATKLGPDLVLMDILLAGKVDGIQAGKYIQEELGIPVVFVTAHGDERTLERAKLNAPFGYVLKPFNERELHTAIEIAIFRHRAESELRRLQQWLKAVLDHMDEAIVVTDKWGFITLFSEQAALLTGWKRSKAVGKALGHVVRLLDPESGQPILLPLNEVLVQPMVHRNIRRCILLGAKETPLAAEFSIVPMSDDNGGVDGVILKFAAVHPANALTSAVRASRPRNAPPGANP